jgi:hypothetical protein
MQTATPDLMAGSKNWHDFRAIPRLGRASIFPPRRACVFPVTLTGSRAIVPAPSTPPPWNIEQGPVLESEKLPVGVVTAINGPAGSPSP